MKIVEATYNLLHTEEAGKREVRGRC